MGIDRGLPQPPPDPEGIFSQLQVALGDVRGRPAFKLQVACQQTQPQRLEHRRLRPPKRGLSGEAPVPGNSKEK